MTSTTPTLDVAKAAIDAGKDPHGLVLARMFEAETLAAWAEGRK